MIRATSPFGSNDALYEPFVTDDPVPKSAFQSVTGAQYSYLGVDNPRLVLGCASFKWDPSLYDWHVKDSLDGTAAPVLATAETCIITPCERTYQLSMIARQLQAVVLDTDYGVSEVLGWPEGSNSPMRTFRWTVAGEQPLIGELATPLFRLSRAALQTLNIPTRNSTTQR